MIDPKQPDYTNTPASPERPPFGYAPADPAAPPAVTIVTPFFNTGPPFHETAQSVLRQSLQQFEWIIVNDGSTDADALAVLDEYRRSDPRIRVIDHEQNRGLSAARNTGFAAARSDFVMQLDSDDLIEPSSLEKYFWYLTSNAEFGFVGGYSVGFGAEQYLWPNGFKDGAAFLERNRTNPNVMVRKSVHAAVGGYDETLRQGLEDWDFWLHCADAGIWGGTIPEYLTWYRRRPSHGDHWQNLASEENVTGFRDSVLKQRYGRLWQPGGFPAIKPADHHAFDPLPPDLPVANLLRKDQPRLLMLVPWMHMGGADKFNLDLLRGLAGRGWDVTIATSLPGDNSWLPQFAAHTPDIFILDQFLRLVDYPRFLRYLISSRQVDAVLISHSELGYRLLPYLRAYFPHLPILDYCHIEEEDWKNGGYPRMAVDYQEQLNLSVASSRHLRDWMVEGGGDGSRIAVCTTNIDAGDWQPDVEQRQAERAELGVSDDAALILYAARLAPQKQPQVLAQTLLNLSRQGLPFVAVVAGDGPMMAWLADFVAQNAMSGQVRLLGEVSEARMHRLMAAADIFFMPSRWEGISLAIYEAMACAVPVVGSDVGGQRELVTPECGVLLSRSDEKTEAEQYAAVLAGLIKDPERRRRLGAAGRARVESEFRLEQMIDAMVLHIADAQRRAVDLPVPAPTRAVGDACAANAVELARLGTVVARLLQERSAKAQAFRLASRPGPRPNRRFDFLPAIIRRPAKRFRLWCIEPSGPLAPLVNGLARIMPRRVKLALRGPVK